MNRLLLAMLALLTGLFAQVNPVQARMCGNGDTEINTVLGARSAARIPGAKSSSVEAPATRQDRRDRDAARGRATRARVLLPTVYFGADRAFE